MRKIMLALAAVAVSTTAAMADEIPVGKTIVVPAVGTTTASKYVGGNEGYVVYTPGKENENFIFADRIKNLENRAASLNYQLNEFKKTEDTHQWSNFQYIENVSKNLNAAETRIEILEKKVTHLINTLKMLQERVTKNDATAQLAEIERRLAGVQKQVTVLHSKKADK